MPLTRQQANHIAATAETESAMGMEMEQKKEKGRDGRKEKKGAAEAKEGNAKGAGHSFFKVFFPEHSGERLKIPPQFQEYLEEEPNRLVLLKGPSGKTWKVMLTSGSQGLGFSQGWKDFVGDHSLERGNFLTFIYDGCSEFSVVVYCVSGVEEKSALDAQPSKEIAIGVEEDEGAQDVDAAAASEQEAVAHPPVEGVGTRKRVRQVDDVMVNDSTPKRTVSVQKKPKENKPNTVSALPNSDKDSSSLLDEYKCYSSTRIRSKDLPRVGTLDTKKLTQGAVKSQRRPITQDDKDQALERAEEFRSKNPFFQQVMMESYVSVGFFMNIPCEFVREWLPQTTKKMKLWDPQGKSWDVNYVYHSGRSVAAFSSGWGKFSVGNNLERFDVCVFELLKEDNIKVHIYRAVPEITPLLCT